ncbi:MAG: DUF4844 domain-containing protein [Spirochaetes bacterium]|nr:DUF4844 domain-containing protein [Spirochaetota bacterium]MBN2772548.1 DUF4844 domain-containing protein [Spirochaetota bacterium]
MKAKSVFILFSVFLFAACFRREQVLEIDVNTVKDLKAFRNTEKFNPDNDTLYPGAPSEIIRFKLESKVNITVDRIIIGLEKNPTKSFVLNELKLLLSGFSEYDSEERDQVCFYCEYIMDILGIESSDGILNRWRYGKNY